MNRKKIASVIYILLTICIIVVIGFLDKDIKDIWAVFRKLNLIWLSIAFLCMFLFWLADGTILQYTTTSMYKRKGFFQSLKVALIGQYYNAVTPFASGGQPVQVYYMMKNGVPIGYATSVLTVKFLAYQTVLSIFCAIAMMLKIQFVMMNYPEILWASIIGFIINAGAIFLIIMIMINKKTVIKMAMKLVDTGHRLKVVKDIDGTRQSVRNHLEDFHKSIEFMKKNTWQVLNICLLTFFQLTIYFSITYFIYRAFGLKKDTLIDIITIQSFLYLAVSFFPTPGASGASEGGFYIFFSMFFHKELLFVSMLIWRLITYYMNIVAGGIIILTESFMNLGKAESTPRG